MLRRRRDFTKTIDCKPGRTLNVFTVFPHMHKIGTKLEVTRSVSGATPRSFYTIDQPSSGSGLRRSCLEEPAPPAL